MNVTDVVFGEDIVLDEEAFVTAISRFSALEGQMKSLQIEIEDMLNILRQGFDTPAGRKLIGSCEERLFEPIKAQALVLAHISTTLQQSKQAYESVFRAYEELQMTINQVNQN